MSIMGNLIIILEIMETSMQVSTNITLTVNEGKEVSAIFGCEVRQLKNQLNTYVDAVLKKF